MCPGTAEAATDSASDEVPPPADTEITADPWIDTPLCTSCNDCMAVNPRLFLYDENKQAYIDDPHTGTFADLVVAAVNEGKRRASDLAAAEMQKAAGAMGLPPGMI